MSGARPSRDPVARRGATTPERTAIVDVDADDAWSYREYDRRVDRVAGSLEALGDRVGLLLDTRPAFAAILFAAMRTGTTLVPLNVRETESEQASKVERTDVEALVCAADTESTALALALADARDTEPIPVLSVDDPVDDRVRGLETAPDEEGNRSTGGGLAGGRPAVERFDPLERDDALLILFTSGTTGEPKGVRLTPGNLRASATASAYRLGVDPDDRWLCCLPMYHMGGLAPVFRSALYGTTAVLQRSFDAQETARVVEDYRITGVSLVPTTCKRLLDAGWSPADRLRFVLLGGAPATEELLERGRGAGVPIYPTYGMTETASQIATATPEQTRDHPGTVGQPLAVTDVSIVDDEGDPVPTGERGEVVVDGPTVTPGYLNPERTEAAFGDRGLATGDIGYADADGRLWIRDRRTDRIVTGGENVDPERVRSALRDHPAVADVAIVGLSDPEWGERVAALVVPGDDRALEDYRESLLARCADRLAGFERPKTVGVVDALPRTASGTVDRGAARERLREVGVDVTDDE